MSVIDQAFVKAFSRRIQATTNGDSAPQVNDAIASPPDVSINPKSEQSAIVWVDAVADQYLRRDEPHSVQSAPARPRTASTGQSMTTGHGNPGGEPRTRGSRPVSHPAPSTTPTTNSSSSAKPVEKATDFRVDTGHPVSQPAANKQNTPTSVSTTPATAASAASITSEPSTNAVSANDLAQFATLPWIEASSTLIETPLNQAITGPYYSDSVIVQENYLPVPIAAPTKTLESVSQPTPTKQADTNIPKTVGIPSETSVPAAEIAPAKQPVTPSFAAVWEVDAFEFSDTVIALFGDAALIRSIGFPLDRAVSEGLQTLLITSIEHGAGRTTVATGIAIAAASSGLRVALIDATMATASAVAPQDRSSLADALNLDIQFGWIEAVRGGISIAETAIHSIEDQLTVLPLVVPMAGLPPTTDEFSRVIQTLRQAFDLVVIDGPPCTEAAFRPLVSHQTAAPSIDAAILVQDMRGTYADQANRVMEMLRRDGITGLGMVQNFV